MINQNLHLLQLWFSKFTPLEDGIYPRLRTTGLDQRYPNFLDAGPKSLPYQRPRAGLFCALKKTKQKNTRITLVTFVRCNMFCLFGNMFAV